MRYLLYIFCCINTPSIRFLRRLGVCRFPRLCCNIEPWNKALLESSIVWSIGWRIEAKELSQNKSPISCVLQFSGLLYHLCFMIWMVKKMVNSEYDWLHSIFNLYYSLCFLQNYHKQWILNFSCFLILSCWVFAKEFLIAPYQ